MRQRFIGLNEFKITRVDKDHFLKNSSEFAKIDSISLKFSWNTTQWNGLKNVFQNYKLFQITNASGYIVGFSLWSVTDSDCAHLLKLVILSQYRDKGLGRALLTHNLEELKMDDFMSYYLEVETSNHFAIKLYERVNFKKIHLKKSFYQDGSDAFAMHLKTN